MRKFLGPILSLALLVGVGAAIYFSASEQLHLGNTIEVRGLIGSEKEEFFRDERVVKALAKQGLVVHAEKAGSRQIATSYDLSKYDFAFPAGVPAAEKIRRDTGKKQSYRPYFTPMAIASWRIVAEVLERNGIAERQGDYYYIVDMPKLLGLIRDGKRWKDVPHNPKYAVNKAVLINSTDVRKSNSAAMYLSLVSYLENGLQIVATDEEVDKVLPLVSDVFLRQGFVEYSSEAPFEDYLVMGIGKAPLVMIYESQFIYRAAQNDGSIRDDMVLMYPKPTVFSKHTLVALSDGGAKLGEALENDAELQRLAVEHGFRTRDVAWFREFAAQHSLPLPEQIVDVIEPPSYEIVEKLIKRIEAQYQ